MDYKTIERADGEILLTNGKESILIWESESLEKDEDGETITLPCYLYNLYDNPNAKGEDIDGGCCTGSLADCIAMATEQAGF
jgi:hypothetical protein